MREAESTAGFRNAGWTMDALPEHVQIGVHPLQTQDGAAVNGFLYTAGPSEVVACIMHPREFLATHYLVPELLSAGYSVFTQTSRAVGSDLRLEHEITSGTKVSRKSFLSGIQEAPACTGFTTSSRSSTQHSAFSERQEGARRGSPICLCRRQTASSWFLLIRVRESA